MPLRRIRRQADYSSQYRVRVLWWLVRLALFGVLLSIVVFIGVIVYFFTQVPSPDTLSNRTYAKASKIYDRNGTLLYDIFDSQNRTPVKINEIPDILKHATIAIEDKDFYKHSGFSVVGILRSFFLLLKNHGSIEGGGSTLTQQLVKNTILTNDQSFVRKIKELILAVQVERYYTKDQILEMYLNEIPYGGTAYGIEAAANLYFGKSAKDLDLAQASLLAGLPQSPSVYSPYGPHPEKAKERQKDVLRRMLEDKYITQAQYDDALKETLAYRTTQREEGIKAPHFVLYIKQKLIDQYGEKMVQEGGLRVTTSLDYTLQQQAETIVKEEVDKLTKYKVGNGAAVVIDPKNGNILAMVGSKDYFGNSEPAGCSSGVNCVFDPNANLALYARQPGSSTKPITYAAGMQKGYTAASMLMDLQTEFPGGTGQPPYIPGNYDGKFRGPVEVRYALANSYNIPAVKMLALVGIKNDMDLAYKMGMTNWEPTQDNISSVGLALTLGGKESRLLDLTSVYGVFANAGVKQDPVSILKVTDSNGKVLFNNKQTDGVKVLDSGIAFIISNILSDNVARTPAFGPNSVLNIKGKTVSVKTGTTDLKRDNWAVGYTPSVVVGVWVGNNNNDPMNQAIASGVTGASPIWSRLMTAAIKDKPDEKPKQPDNVIQSDVDSLIGGLPVDGRGVPSRKEYFIKGTEPKTVSSFYIHGKVCSENPHKLANDDQDGIEKDIIAITEDDPTGANKWQTAIDAWAQATTDMRFVISQKGCALSQPTPSPVTFAPNKDLHQILAEALSQIAVATKPTKHTKKNKEG
jgi:1A family penicillin-binding protein